MGSERILRLAATPSVSVDKGESVGILGPCPTSLIHLRSPMTTTRFTQLSDAPIREAWPDEARDFTPWLFDHIDFLSEALARSSWRLLPPKLQSTTFRSTSSRRTPERVIGCIIENQLEVSDHRHLGQVPYLPSRHWGQDP